MRHLTVKRLRVDDTFAEAFTMRATGVIITADSAHWARQAAVTMTGFATSVIGCGCEAGIDHELTPRETPHGRAVAGSRPSQTAKAAADQGRPVRAHEPRVCVLRRP